MADPWKLKRVAQCEKCPWRVDVDPFDIPDGYSVELHRGLEQTIARPDHGLFGPGKAMACHETEAADETHCIGWLVNQLGTGNNIGLRIRMMSCENAHAIKLRGEQHATFADTLPRKRRKPRTKQKGLG